MIVLAVVCEKTSVDFYITRYKSTYSLLVVFVVVLVVLQFETRDANE